jgi:hypothetical protein
VCSSDLLEPRIDEVEAAVSREIDARMPPFRCKQGELALPPTEPVCIDQKVAWTRARPATVVALQPTIAGLLSGPIVGVGVLVADVGSVSAGERPEPAVSAEAGPRVGRRWVGWGADAGGPFVETLRKLSVGDNHVAVRIVARPPAAP